MPRLHLHLLGSPLVELDGEPVHLQRRKALALLAYVALTHRSHSRDSLATLLWPNMGQGHARARLRRTLSLLNRTLGSGWFTADRETAGLAPETEVWLDVDVLRRCLACCQEHSHPAEDACPDCIPLLAEAVDLYRDGFLTGFTLPDAPAFDEWQFFEGEELCDRVAGALQRLATWHDDRGEFDAAIPYARRWLALDPAHEPAHRALMMLYARSGQRAAALRQYEECERLLAEELAVAPAPETTQLYEAIRGNRELPGTGAAALEPVPPGRTNLPAQSTPFVGRERELAELDHLFADPEVRLLTIVGPGGIGKTRLALEAAAKQIDRYPDGVWFVSLAPVRSVEAMAPTVARAMEMPLSGSGPPRQQLLHYLRHRRTLLLLDNLEHLLEGVDLLAEILGSAPEVKLLVTSRTRLTLRGEQALGLSGLDYPALAAAEVLPGQVRRYSSVVLFSRSARRAQPEFELNEQDLPHVAHICQLAQGMPLAILLAAAWVPTLSPAEVAAEMERGLDILAAEWGDEPARHRSMRATFDVTWALLNDMERQAFARLSVFRGGFTRQAVQAVAGADLRTLTSLVHKSLVQRGQAGRYEVHELLRQYAEERLDQDPGEKERVPNQHCAYYAELLDREKEQIDRGYGRQEIMPELNNIRAAWQHAVSRRLTANLKSLLCVLGSLHVLSPQERYVALGRAVDALRSGHSGSFTREEASVLGELLRTRAYAAFLCRHEQQVSQLLQESEEILRHYGETVELAWVMADRAVLGAVESSAEAEQLLLEALAIWTKAGEQLDIAHAHHALGECAIRRGAYQKAEWHCQEALRINERLDNRFVAGYALMAWGYAVYLQGDYARARRLYERCLPIELAIGDPTHIPATHYLLGQVALALGEYEDATRHFRQALIGYEDLQIAWTASLSGFCRGSGLSLARLGDVALAVNDAEEAQQRYAQALRVAADEPHPELRLEAVLGQAKLLAQRQDAPSLQERAAELATFVLGHPGSLPETREAAQRLLDGIERALSSGAFAAAKARGRARGLDATLQELLAELAKG